MHGFNVNKTKVIISEQTPIPRAETVKVIRNIWNNDTSIQLMRDWITTIHIDKVLYHPHGFIGEWWDDSRMFKIYDDHNVKPSYYEVVTIHELDGHAFYQWARTNRSKQLNDFYKLAVATSPITQYIKNNKSVWKEDLYADEQHSAIAEIVTQ